ncbi:MAG: hypothetical protein IKN58_04930 [Prevotella sp.]|nr:hypothetical protein [Prevotella sp.]
MAKINLTLRGVLHYEEPVMSKQTTGDITLATEQTSCDIYSQIKDGDSTILKYSLALKEFSFHKKMYQPTEVLALVNITKAVGVNYAYQRIGWTMLDKMFKHAKVSLTDGDFTIGNDYYVHEVLPHYQKDCMNVILKIYSVDKLMTIRQASRTFVAKKLFADILDNERLKYMRPWVVAGVSDSIDKTKDKQAATDIGEGKSKGKDDHTHITVDTNNMKILRYGNEKTEHIFPYLVQYNESFYDMLARTANRWGEFMFYEDNQLNIGYNDVAPVAVDESEIKDIAVFDAETKQLTIGKDGEYDYSANNGGLAGKPVEKSPFIVRAQMGAFGGMVDKWIINQLTAVFKNEKNLPTLIGNLLFDNLFNLGKEKAKIAKLNSDFDKKYKFDKKPGYANQYGSYDFAKKGQDPNNKDAFQQFTELNSKYDDKKYISIVEKELTVGQKAIHIDYDTTHPKLKLGSIISFNDMNFIVVEILGVKSASSDMTFQLVATAQDPVDKIFYPSVIPAGHIRYAYPQPATITDADDPSPNRNRARVLFAWQNALLKKDGDEKITSATKELSTPWLNFASNQQGHPILGKHYEGNPVMVGFEEGNVERPYIMGGMGDVSGKPNQDLTISSPGEHMLSLTDGTGAGMQAFLAGAFSPLFKNFTQFMPNTVPTFNWDKNKYFEGGFELTDRYGMYKVSGSTDGRNVSIASNWGDVKINAFTGISISAPNGDVKISGKNVTIEAGNNLNLVSGKNVDYKLWKSKEGKGKTAAQLLIDVTAQVTKRLAETIMDVIDLSLIRSVVEVFFRPVEGSLTLKSNRFLKLEAGNNECKMPTEAFSAEGQKKMQEAIDKAAIEDAKGIGDGMIEIFNVTATLALNHYQYFAKKYNECVDDLKKVDAAIRELRKYTNDESTDEDPVYVCKTFDQLKKDLWKQEKDENWKEDQFDFTDQVASAKGTKIENDDLARITNLNITKFHGEAYNNLIKAVLGFRNDNKNIVVTAYNQLRKHIYELQHHTLTEQDIAIAFSHLKSPTIPKDYQKKVLAAFDPKKLEKVPYYTEEIDEPLKNLDSKIDREPTATDDVVIMLRRLVIINLLEEFGFKNSTRAKLNKINMPDPKGEVPDKPTADTVLDTIVWRKYLRSLSGVPTIDALKKTTLGGALKDAVKGAASDQLDKIKFWKGISERKNWGDGKNGQILFTAGQDTYCMDDHGIVQVTSFESSITLPSDINKVIGDKNKESLEGFVEKLRKALSKY